MARKAQRRGLDPRRLVFVETVLLLGLLGEIAEDAVLDWQIVHPLIRVALAIAIVVGAFGGVVLLFEQYLHRGMERTEAAARRLRVPAIVVHALALVGIFLGYAWYWDARTGALGSIRALLRTLTHV